jgi:arylsulfatase A-like enzyme
MATDAPNLLFVFADQHRATATGYGGEPDVVTPNLDRLAAEGRRYPNACATVPVCSPSRACLLTGQYPGTHGVIANDLQLPTDAPSVAEAFREAGYRTGYVGKWHLDGTPRDRFTPPGPRRQGFDDFWAVQNCSHDYTSTQYYRDDPDPIGVDGYEPVEQTDRAMEFVRGDDDRPFWLFLSYGPPHGPYRDLPDAYLERYDPTALTLRPNVELTPPESRVRPQVFGPSDEASLRERIAGYYAHVTALDEQIGRLLDCLDANGLREETIVTYTSDHGDMLGSQGVQKKEWPWTESIGVPFVVRWPGEIPAGTRDRTPIATVDVTPTLCGLAGIDPPQGVEGTDRSSGVRGLDAAGPESAFVTLPFPHHLDGVPEWRAARTRRYTYARTRNGEPWLLYDDLEDPHQLRNRALDSGHHDIRASLDRRLDALLDRIDDPFLAAENELRRVGRVEAWNAAQRDLGKKGLVTPDG